MRPCRNLSIYNGRHRCRKQGKEQYYVYKNRYYRRTEAYGGNNYARNGKIFVAFVVIRNGAFIGDYALNQPDKRCDKRKHKTEYSNYIGVAFAFILYGAARRATALGADYRFVGKLIAAMRTVFHIILSL